MGWDMEIGLVGEMGCVEVWIISYGNQWGMSWRRVIECNSCSMRVQVEIGKVVKKPVAHKSVVHVALSGTIRYEPFFK